MHLLYVFTLPNRGRIQLDMGSVYSIIMPLTGLLLFCIDISYKIHHIVTRINLQIGKINLDSFLFFGHKDGRYT